MNYQKLTYNRFAGTVRGWAEAAFFATAAILGISLVIVLLLAGALIAAEATGVAAALRGPSDGERVAECRALPGFPNFDRDMRFSGCEAQ